MGFWWEREREWESTRAPAVVCEQQEKRDSYQLLQIDLIWAHSHIHNKMCRNRHLSLPPHSASLSKMISLLKLLQTPKHTKNLSIFSLSRISKHFLRASIAIFFIFWFLYEFSCFFFWTNTIPLETWQNLTFILFLLYFRLRFISCNLVCLGKMNGICCCVVADTMTPLPPATLPPPPSSPLPSSSSMPLVSPCGIFGICCMCLSVRGCIFGDGNF